MEWIWWIVLAWAIIGLAVGWYAYATAKQQYKTGRAADDESRMWFIFSVLMWPLTLLAFRAHSRSGR